MINELHSKIIPEPNSGCWIWLGGLSCGYGKTLKDYVHRLSYIEHKGKIPKGKEIDHICRNKLCCNPEHLEAVTHAENSRRHFRQFYSCQNGHDLYGDNLICLRGKRGTQRRCKICHRERMRRYRE